MHELKASIFVLPEPSRRQPASDLWAAMAHDLQAEQPERYAASVDWRYRVCMSDERIVSPDKAVLRYRTIEAAIRRSQGRPTLLDLSVGNLFSAANSSKPSPIHIVHDPRYAQWARRAAQVALVEHVRLIKRFIEDLLDAGWAVQPACLSPMQLAPPQVRNGERTCPLPTEKFYQLVKRPAVWPTGGVDFVVVTAGGGSAARAVAELTRAFEALFGVGTRWSPKISSAREPAVGATNLVLLGEDLDLTTRPEVRDMLRTAEAAGARFKLAIPSSLASAYPAQNIVYDMFLIAGGRPWVPVERQPPFCSVDAGHHKEDGRSRWTRVETNADQLITSVKCVDTPLAEHIPPAVLSQLWPSDPQALLCRDGKLSQERAATESRANVEKRSLIEAKKSPRAVLWHETETGLTPAKFGDALVDEHGDILLQTVRQDPADYIHPMRLTCQGIDLAEAATVFLHQQAVPPLSLFRQSRLPGALYFADLVSKRTADGWPKAIGRGFNVPQIVPDLGGSRS